ncbi:Inosine/uridine-preferring nucleoside hydrolase [Rubrobacter xylanophilus DSM 9941]|uniref:Inosine/uridine-preferring nucleoside hydrolase n=1 Tax=Rubrobacter xylanophilus (strain DSM 9941 / JCM 11954 / NBRC 16129 / PRD-1) TaxID=266117 RepID=Q1AUT2_RUBXD|nr:nucleoside hydrolase [Rubrobacter xylanophilus]ABG04846.1 Inosine/uridine-preferring nucleoside hydrolase [Rubrobacter xylanophilus DSM 9941]
MKRFLVDTDTAGDDVTSLLFALRWPGVSLEGITVVAGNVYLHEALENALYTVEISGRARVPVFPGADRPMLRSLVTAHEVHGEDGMGNSNFPKANQRPEKVHAVDAIVDTADRWSGELEIIAQAPLTNLALAVMKDPDLPKRVRRLWIMGGSNNSLGNITPAAEFNFYVDPEAARIVLGAGFNTTVVPWDVCLKDGVLTRPELAPILKMKTKLSEFYLAVNRAAWEFNRTRVGGVDGITHPDSIMTAMAIDEEVILDRERYFVDVECCGSLTRGYSLVDELRVLGKEANAEVVLRADKAKFKEMLARLLED